MPSHKLRIVYMGLEYASLRDGESACFSAAGLPGSGTDKPGRNEWGNLLRGDDFPFKAGDRYRQYYFSGKGGNRRGDDRRRIA